MYIVAIAWIYVVLMMAVTEQSVAAAVMTLLFYGVAPLALFLWLFGTPSRRRARLAAERAQSAAGAQAVPGDRSEDVAVGEAVDQAMDEQDAAHPERNQDDLLHGGAQFRPLVKAGNEIGDRHVDHAGGRDA